jgi:3',5'-cyclic AMP phosphodiesterase CpdA
MPTTVALRFRDLAGPTIPAHRDRIEQKGTVWWAWWAKPEEKIPRDFLADLTSRLESGEDVWLFLVDSGHDRVYRAKLNAIEVAPGNQAIASPDADRTPAYYADQSYRVWFEFSAIEDADAQQLSEFSYDELPQGAFDEDSAREDFDGKRVFDVSELLGRHRTMYFLRPSERTDPSHKVTLGASERTAPFMTRSIEVPSHYVLHLSDLHFGDHHAFPVETNPPRRNLAIRVIDDLKTLYGETPPAAVIISGDFTWFGTAAEFEKATSFIDEFQSVYKLHPSRFVICPGNHDIQWADVEAEQYAPKAPVTRARHEAESHYRQFVQKALQLTFPGESLAMGRRFLLSNFMPLDIVAVNSSRLESRHFAGYGFVSREQVLAAADAMGWLVGAEPGPKLRVLVLHHHVVPVVPQEEIFNPDERYSLTLDAAQLLYTALEYGVDLIVHGHQHQPFTASYGRLEKAGVLPPRRQLAIQAAGSAGVKVENIPAFGRNSYCVYEVGERSVKVLIRAASEDIDGFGPYWDYTLDRDARNGLRSPI